MSSRLCARSILGLGSFLAFVLVHCPLVSWADTVTWDNDSTDGLWSTAANWSGNAVPVAGDDIVFDATSVSNCMADDVSNNLASITLDTDYTGTVTFEKNGVAGAMSLSVTGAIAVTDGHIVFEGDTSVTNGGTVGNPYGIGYDITAASIMIGVNGSINADGKGFPHEQGPGVGVTGETGGGGGYGGTGASSLLYQTLDSAGGLPCGAAGSPSALGSGGGDGRFGSDGGPGGGAIKLSVSGAITVNGTLSAKGGKGTNGGAGGGSGGSIWIAAGTLAGTGTISANGGEGSNNTNWQGGGGGGGRIDISSVVNNFVGSLEVLGGETGAGYFVLRNGFTGTIAFPAGHFDDFVPCTDITLGHGITFGNVTVTNGVTLTLDASKDDNSYDFTSLTVSNGGNVVVLGDPWAINSASGGVSTNPHGIGVVINADNISIASGGSINANWTRRPMIPLKMGPGGGDYSSGGGYGGGGGSGFSGSGGLTYGSSSAPTALGSSGGSGGPSAGSGGGGAIKLNVSGATTVDGTLSANGKDGEPACGGGSGGSLWIVTRILTGIGVISANGGDGTFRRPSPYESGGGGGGGRMRIEYISVGDDYKGAITATGGTRGDVGTEDGEDGTITYDITPPGTLIIIR